ncbi:beta-ketoacyl synthase N-terminal-like domain-containing protein [Streptomyces sp. RKAG293]|uniref:beta-ketoacyl synthase N-terminal-like domain-containing protein n=1 Tax=Streptomyces sp. RKAG293 TaxID=2893403 RepID=UPI002034185B|nr:beta-ketoacyl synthase N-terminal-like domain-containing protein [Streptomyces sp. RKAG293]MCM2416760.1 polyketide beta-ketoacyl:ACP synthase [Streptomyces sp. RKAG293]
MSPAARIAVTGLGVLCSVGDGVTEFTESLRTGRSGLSAPGPGPAPGPAFTAPLRDFALDRSLDALRQLPAPLRDLALRTARRSPLPVQAAVTVALQAWQQAGLHEVAPPGDRTGVVVAGSNLTERYTEDSRARATPNPAYLPARYALHHQDTDHVATLSRVLGITGEGFTVGGASASGNVGLVSGARMLAVGVADVCLVVGALSDLSELQIRGFLTLGAMAVADAGNGGPGEHPAAPFDTRHRGFHPGQGAACLVLETEESARRRGAAVLGRLAGHAIALDGNHLADPSADGEARAMRAALAAAGLAPRDIAYVSAHGTGSPLGDATETTALRDLFGEAADGPWVNATKGLTGHCLAAAGVVEAVAVMLQIREGFVHPSPGLDKPADPGCRFSGPVAARTDIAFALSNGFGFGGINTSVALAHPDT